MCYVMFVPALIWSHITLALGLLGIAGITFLVLSLNFGRSRFAYMLRKCGLLCH
jgi:hypothetical protein